MDTSSQEQARRLHAARLIGIAEDAITEAAYLTDRDVQPAAIAHRLRDLAEQIQFIAEHLQPQAELEGAAGS